MKKGRQAIQERDGTFAALALALIVGALWMPSGFVNGIIEEWLFLDQFRRGMSPFQVEGQFLRPLVLVPFYAGLALTPGSFVGLNLVLMFAIWGRSLGLYLVLRQLGARPTLGMAAAFLFALYPADDGQMTTRTVGIQVSVMLLLISTYLLLRLARDFRPWLALGTMTCLAVTILGYEAPIPLAMVIPLLVLWKEGRRRGALGAIGAWYAVLIPLVIRYLYLLFTARSTYQSSLMVFDGSLRSFLDMVRALDLPYRMTLWHGWGRAFEALDAVRVPDLLLGLGVAAVATSILAAFQAPSADESAARAERRLIALLVPVAVAVIALGFAMYLPSNARETTWRTLFLPSIGGAVLTAIVLRVAARAARRPKLFVVGVGVLLVPAFSHLVLQHRQFAQIAANQEQLLDGIVAATPHLSPRTRLVLLFDETGHAISHEYFPFSRYFRAALATRFRLGDLNAHICYPFTSRRDETCTFDSDSVQVFHHDMGWLAPKLGWDVPYESVVAVEQDKYGRVRLLDSLPPWYTLQEEALGYQPWLLVATGEEEVPRVGQIRVDFDEQAFVGAGWDVQRVTAAGITYRFMSHHTGALHLPLEQADYAIDVTIANGISHDLLGSLGASVNGHRIALEQLPLARFRGRIPAELIADSGDTVLLFHQDPEILERIKLERGPLLGLGFDRVQLDPTDSATEAP